MLQYPWAVLEITSPYYISLFLPSRICLKKFSAALTEGVSEASRSVKGLEERRIEKRFIILAL